MMDNALRIPKERVLTPVVRRLESISPLVLTGFALLAGLLAALLTGLAWYGVGLVFWLINRLLDGLDGEVARAFDKQTDLGGYLDILADFLVYALIPLALVIANPSAHSWLALGILLTSFYVNAASWMYLAALVEKRRHTPHKTSIAIPTGFIEGAETIICYSLFLLFPHTLTWLFIGMSVGLVITILQRVVWAQQHLKDTL